MLAPALALALALASGASYPHHRRALQPNLPHGRSVVFQFLPSGVAASEECTGNALTGSKGESITFTRSGNQTCLKSDGTLVTLTTDQPALEAAGLHVEAAGTNYFLGSEAIGASPWQTAGTVTANATAGPDGATTATRIQFTATNASVYQIGSGGTNLGSAMTTGTVSAFFKQGPGGAGPASAGVDFGTGVSTCTCTTSDGTSCTNVNSSGTFCAAYLTTSTAWTRLMVTASNTVGATSPVSFVRPGVAGTVATGDIYVDNAQLEPGKAFASSYIKTVGTTATRNATSVDLPDLTLSGTPSQAMTVTLPGLLASNAFLLTTGVSSTDRLQTYWLSTPRCAYTSNSGTTEKAHSSDIPLNTATRLACYYDGANLGICNGGVCLTQAGSLTIGAATVVNGLGYRRTGSDLYMSGWVKAVCIDSTLGGCR